MFVLFIDCFDLLDKVGKFFLVINQVFPDIVLCERDDLGQDTGLSSCK